MPFAIRIKLQSQGNGRSTALPVKCSHSGGSAWWRYPQKLSKVRNTESALMKHRTQLLFAGVILVFSVISAKAQQAPITCNGLLSKEQVRQLLTAGVADVRVREFVSKCGVDFPLTPTTENRLRKAGASDSLIKLARERSAAEQQR